MADPEHVSLARSGPNAINRWRETTFRSPNKRITRYSLGYRLEDRSAGETFQPEFIYGRPALELSGASLSGAKLAAADLSHDDLSGADLTASDLHRADLSGAKLQAAHLWRSNLSYAILNESQMSGCSLGRTNLSNASLHLADLRGADLSFANLNYANLEGADLTGADLTEADLSWANLSRANLRGASLTATVLNLADLTKADLRGAKITKAALESTIFYKAAMGMTLLANCDLSRTIGLESVLHTGPSTISLDTITGSRGLVPPSFLKGAGVAAPMIAAQNAVSEADRAYRTVLVVCSKDDTNLARRLVEGLALAKISSWTLAADDEEALQSGEETLDQTVYYDRLVLLCTAGSLDNPLTSRYFAELVRSNERVSGNSLITVGADETLYGRDDRLCSNLKQVQVQDFRGWADDKAYQVALAALVRVLTS